MVESDVRLSPISPSQPRSQVPLALRGMRPATPARVSVCRVCIDGRVRESHSLPLSSGICNTRGCLPSHLCCICCQCCHWSLVHPSTVPPPRPLTGDDHVAGPSHLYHLYHPYPCCPAVLLLKGGCIRRTCPPCPHRSIPRPYGLESHHHTINPSLHPSIHSPVAPCRIIPRLLCFPACLSVCLVSMGGLVRARVSVLRRGGGWARSRG